MFRYIDNIHETEQVLWLRAAEHVVCDAGGLTGADAGGADGGTGPAQRGVGNER